MITLTTEQAQQIEKSLSGWKEYDAWTDQQMWNNDDEKALVTIREARAQEQAEQEPVAWMNEERNTITWDQLYPNMTPLYAAPVHTKDLTDAIINELHKDAQDPISFARAVIAADRRKNK